MPDSSHTHTAMDTLTTLLEHAEGERNQALAAFNQRASTSRRDQAAGGAAR